MNIISGKRKEESLYDNGSDIMSTRFHFPGSFDTLTPFSKLSTSPTFYRDGSESEVEDIYESMSNSGNTSRCSSADTSKDSIFSPFMRSRSLSTGSKKSPRNSHSCSPANNFRSCSTDDEGRDSVGSVSRKFNSFSMHEPSSPRSLSVSETILEDDDESLPPLPTFFSPEQQLGKSVRGRADSFGDDIDYSATPGLIKMPSYELVGSPQVLYNDENSKASNVEPVKYGHFKGVMPFQPHTCSVFSPHPSTSGTDNCEPPPIPPFEPSSSPVDGGGVPAVIQRSVSLSGLRRDSCGIAQTLNFGDSFTTFTTSRLSDHDPTSHSATPSLSMMSFREHTYSDFSRNRHPSVNANLSRGSTISGPTPSFKKRNNLDDAPQSPPAMERTLSQTDEYVRHNNPRFATNLSVICTPQGAQTRSLKTCGEDGDDWAVTECRGCDELKSFIAALRVSVNGPRVKAASSKERDMCRSMSPTFDVRAI